MTFVVSSVWWTHQWDKDILTFEIVLWSVRVSCQAVWGSPLPNVTRYSGWWPHTVTPSIDGHYTNFWPLLIWTLLPNLTFLPSCARFPWSICNGCCVPTEDAYSSGHLVLFHFGTYMCSNVETNLSWTCLVSGLLNFEHPSVLLFCFVYRDTLLFVQFYKYLKLDLDDSNN